MKSEPHARFFFDHPAIVEGVLWSHCWQAASRCIWLRAGPGGRGYNDNFGKTSAFYIEASLPSGFLPKCGASPSPNSQCFQRFLALNPPQTLFHFPASTFPVVPTQGSPSPAPDKEPAGRKPNIRRLACKPLFPNFSSRDQDLFTRHRLFVYDY